jgi:methionyl-tRNA formyltransferase
MNIAFAGTPEFAAAALTALLEQGFHVPLVLTQPDRPGGRGMQLQMSAVKQVALAHGIEVIQPASLKREPQAAARLAAASIDVMVVAAYGLILPQAVLDIPRRGCLNIHASLLPRWRGAAPIARAIEAGDSKSGVCIMQMEAGLDTGPVLLREELAIAADDTAATLHDRLAALGARMIVDALRRLDTLQAVPQAATGMTYAAKIGKAEAALDFRRPAPELARKIRAFDPFPGAAGSIGGASLKIWGASPCAMPAGIAADAAAPGRVLAAGPQGIVVACAAGSALRLELLQKPGGKRLPARQFLQGLRLAAGARFDLPAPAIEPAGPDCI